MENIIVLKFGGSSVANNECLNRVMNIIKRYHANGDKVVVVVSAQGKTTDKLIQEANELSDYPDKQSLDMLVSTGEIVSSAKLAILLNANNLKSVALTGGQAGIMTSSDYQKAIIKTIDSSRIIEELRRGKIVIVAGFQGIDDNKNIATLGRGGSDTTAVALSVALNAKSCIIYSDVDGIYTVDPKLCSDADKLDKISYCEMLDVSNEGAKVLHNRCVELAKKFDMPIVAKSTFQDDEKSGTVVSNIIETQKVKSIVYNDKIVLVRIRCCDELGIDRIYKALIENDIMPAKIYKHFKSKVISCVTNSFDKEHVNKVISEISSDSTITFKKISKISVIGYGITNNSEVIQKVLECVIRSGIKPLCYDISSGKITLYFDKKITKDNLNFFHRSIL